MRRFFTMTAVAFLVAGCATYSDLKSSQPAAIHVVKGTPTKLVDCYIDRRMGDYEESYQKLEIGSTLRLVVRNVPLWGTPSLVYELDFTQLDHDLTRIELRDTVKPIVDLGGSNNKIVETVAGCGAA